MARSVYGGQSHFVGVCSLRLSCGSWVLGVELMLFSEYLDGVISSAPSPHLLKLAMLWAYRSSIMRSVIKPRIRARNVAL